MNFLCPSCRTPLPRAALESVTCTGCGVAVDLARVETAPGQARLWPEVDLSGESLGGYTLVKLLGSGGMGTVYEARTADGAQVALKVLAPLLAAEPALRGSSSPQHAPHDRARLRPIERHAPHSVQRAAEPEAHRHVEQRAPRRATPSQIGRASCRERVS
jgi:serine/threonine protein kinase